MVKISNLPTDTVIAGGDKIAFVDVSEGTTEQITRDELMVVGTDDLVDESVTPAKQSEVTVLEATGTSFSQSSPGSGTWYNILSITLPAGHYKASYGVTLNADANSASQWRLRTTLSTANNTESDSTTTTYISTNLTTGGTSNSLVRTFRAGDILLDVASSTTFYLNVTPNTGSMGTITQSTSGANYLRAVPIQAWTV